MNVDTDLCITLNRTEAEQMRTALHIATRLATLLPFGLNQPVWAQAFKELHNSFVDAGVAILPGAPAFSDNVLTALANAEHPDDRLLRDLLSPNTVGYGGRPGDLSVIAGRDRGGKTFAQRYGMTGPQFFEQDYADIERRVMACLLDPIPPMVLDASQLPFEFKGTVTGRNVMPGPAMPDNLKRTLLPDVLMDDQSARHVGLTASQTGLVNKAEPKGWIVQVYGNRSQDWEKVSGGPPFATLVYSSRNEAYRQMRQRSERMGVPLRLYRVVPAGTPDGKEKDRGFYTVQFFTKFGRPVERGWNTSTFRSLSRTFPTSGAAQSAIDDHLQVVGEHLRKRYRVKWHPSRA